MANTMTEAAGRDPRPLLGARVPAHLYFLGSAIFHYLGPAFAVLLFARAPVPGVAWLRIVSAACIFALWRRPWKSFLDGDTRQRAEMAALGAVFAAMNYSFYMAIDRLPLGTVAAIEFVGPVVLALLGIRSPRNMAAFALAVSGVVLLTDVRLASEPAGFAWAFLNCALFTGYIVIAHRVSRHRPPTGAVDRLGASMLIAAVVITPIGIGSALPMMSDWVAIAAGIGVGVSSSVIPYIFDQLAMARLPRSTYALFVALLPATAVVIGMIVLGQIPAWPEIAAIGLVVAGVLTHRTATTGGGVQ